MHDEKMGPWLEIRAKGKSNGAGRTVLSFLESEVRLPRAVIEDLARAKHLVLNKDIAQLDDPVKTGDRLRALLFPEEPYGVEPEMLPLDVLYEDHHLIIVNKPVGMKVHANEAGETGTLLHALAWHYQMQGLETRVRLLHRLDQDTSGAILFPKHAVAQRLLDAMLQERSIKREYWALVQGVVRVKQGTVEAPIGRDRNHATRRRVSATGKEAQTHFQVVERFPQATLVQASLGTGRTHQIRVHFAHLGHPLVGDELYGGRTDWLDRQALHAKYLRFTHPITQEELEIEAPEPNDFADLLRKVKHR
ncbi:RluA family pseudouridine synthase [Tumebacillus permanentifrigoris]|uniref:Pseudouridine synthase n=1 Tax=Tumebacillus permanentifrigoris TaxID=378543 RepID=A0A316DDN5_9BACL|nr:RluA family pseudouridine synthase [Tumebacillus permanentifrigoris]PWK15806.1 RluA family pseudouridine synthase [Tumebacillus permanentifrigoris]